MADLFYQSLTSLHDWQLGLGIVRSVDTNFPIGVLSTDQRRHMMGCIESSAIPAGSNTAVGSNPDHRVFCPIHFSGPDRLAVRWLRELPEMGKRRSGVPVPRPRG